jgi:hypothetical protein
MSLPNYEDAMTEGWKDIMPLLAREYRQGFECGYFGRYMELEPRMSDAYSQGYARGYELAQMEGANND